MLQRVVATIFTLAVCVGPAVAGDPTALVGGRSAKFKDRPGAGTDSASVTFAKDSGLWSLEVPTCDGSAGGAFVRFSTSEQVNPKVELPCDKWTGSGAGFRYRDKEGTQGGIQKVIYKFGKLVVKAKGAAYDPPITGPVSFVEVRFDVGEKNHCGRFTGFRKNDAAQVRATRPSEACEVVCGDGIPEGGEECDDGNTTSGDGCDDNCAVSGCGNGVVTAGEECDDGNTTNGDGCDSNCTPTACGNGVVTAGEDCDDGNTTNGDGCDDNCTPTACGNGVVTAGEDCDDGNTTNGDGCDSNCTPTACGNGVVTAGEDCDDGNTAGGDGCRADCTVELCGDTIIDPNEECDDGNQYDGDCCSSACLLDPVGAPCDDGQFCTNDSCDNGVCISTYYVPSECSDGNFCTDDECDENLSGGFGACTHTLNTRPCSDGNDCTVYDVCTGGQCVPGEFTVPWINEIDYDDQSEGAGPHDNDEFIEIAGPSGMDISNHWLVSVEGGGSGCNTPLFYNVGVVHWTAQIPAGTVLKGGTCVGGGNDGYRCASTEDCPGGVCDDPSLIGYYVACFGDTSTDVVHCDGQFDKDWIDSTVHNADVYNTNDSCPDGVVLADHNFQPGSPTSVQSIESVVDALSYEGVVPNVGAGALFYAPQLVVGDPGSYLPYDMGTDEGGGYCGGFAGLAVVDAPGVSLEKRSDIAGRAISAEEWFDSGNCDDLAQIGHTGNCILGFCECVPDVDCVPNSATPGGPNAGQEAMTCAAEAVCGDGTIDPPEDCDTAAPNPDEPCAVGQVCEDDCACRVPAVCGNGTVEWGETCDIANGNADCGPAELCNATCQCEPLYCGNGQLDPDQGEECDLSAGVDCVPPENCEECMCNLPPLGSLAFDIADGPADVCPALDVMGSWTKTHGGPEGGLAGGPPVCNGTIGGWTGSIHLVGGSPDDDGIADLTIDGVNVYGADMNPNACALLSQPPCRLCFRLRQDPLGAGYVDCDGGTSVDVEQIVTSNGASPPPPPDPETMIGGGPDSGSGAAILFGFMKNGMFQVDPCPAWDSSVWDSVEEEPVVFTTGTGLSRIHDPRVCAGGFGSTCPNVDPYEVTLTGQNLDCDNWMTSTSGVLVMPASVLDMALPLLGTGDLAQVTRLCQSADCQEPAP